MHPTQLTPLLQPRQKKFAPLVAFIFHPWAIFSSTGVLAIASFATAIPLAQAAVLESWQFDPTTNQLEIILEDETTPRYSVLGQPPVIILDLPNTQLGQLVQRRTYSGAVRQIRVSQLRSGLARIAIELSPGVVLTPAQVQLQRVGLSGRSARFTQRWVLRPLIAETAPSVPTTLPPAIFSPQTPMVSVPPLRTPAAIERVSSNPLGEDDEETERLSDSQSQLTYSDRTPIEPPSRILPQSTRQIAEPTFSAVNPADSSVVAFGEPLPNTLPAQIPTNRVPTFDATTPRRTNRTSGVPPAERGLRRPVTGDSTFGSSAQPNRRRMSQSPAAPLTKGTVVSLYYPGEDYLRLPSGPPRQEVLLLAEDLRDRNGRLIAPRNTPVLGRFESDSRGSRFIVQALTLRGRNVPFAARSEILSGDRTIPGNRVGRNSGIGALAGFLLGGISGIGLLVGAAAGATATVLTAPQPATIAPGQIVEVRLTDDWY